MTPLGLLLTLSFALLVLCQPRRIAAVGIIAAACFVTEGQVLDVGVFHFTAVRIALLAGLIRVVSRGETRQIRFNRVDGMLVAYACSIGLISTLRVGTVEQLVYQVGNLYNIFLTYLVFRCLLRDERDFREVLRMSAFLLLPLALLMVRESLTNSNVFSVFGGVEDASMIRDGQVRSQGPFHSPITAGAFGMTFSMLYASLLFRGVRTRLTLIGLVASLLIMICAHSSGPFLGFVVGLLALICWRFRRHTPTIRWGILAVLVGLQLVMKAPVWFLLARASDLVGGGGYHRAKLIEQFVNHFDSWWLAGISDTRDWFPYQLRVNGQADITNAFVGAGINGGVVGLVLLVTLIVCCFQRLGLAMRRSRGNEPPIERMLWGIGSTLVASIGVLFSVSYFDQVQVIWYLLLAYIASLEIRKKQIPAHYGEKLKRSVPAGLSGGLAFCPRGDPCD
jgi:hypothetical protein